MIIETDSLLYNYQEIVSKKTQKKWAVLSFIVEGSPTKFFVPVTNSDIVHNKIVTEFLKNYKLQPCKIGVNVMFTENGIKSDLMRIS